MAEGRQAEAWGRDSVAMSVMAGAFSGKCPKPAMFNLWEKAHRKPSQKQDVWMLRAACKAILERQKGK